MAASLPAEAVVDEDIVLLVKRQEMHFLGCCFCCFQFTSAGQSLELFTYNVFRLCEGPCSHQSLHPKLCRGEHTCSPKPVDSHLAQLQKTNDFATPSQPLFLGQLAWQSSLLSEKCARIPISETGARYNFWLVHKRVNSGQRILIPAPGKMPCAFLTHESLPSIAPEHVPARGARA